MVAEQILQRAATDLVAIGVVLGVFWRSIGRPAYRTARKELLELIAATVAAKVAEELSKWTSWRSDIDTTVRRLERELASLTATVHERTELGYAHPVVVPHLPEENP